MSAAISARTTPGAAVARIERIKRVGDRMELRLRLGDGSRRNVTLLDDGVNSLELTKGARVFVNGWKLTGH